MKSKKVKITFKTGGLGSLKSLGFSVKSSTLRVADIIISFNGLFFFRRMGRILERMPMSMSEKMLLS